MQVRVEAPTAGEWPAAGDVDYADRAVYEDDVRDADVADDAEFPVRRETEVETQHGQLGKGEGDTADCARAVGEFSILLFPFRLKVVRMHAEADFGDFRDRGR